MNNMHYIDATKYWLEKTIIGFNFCPFAKKEFVSNKIHYEVIDEQNTEEQLHALFHEFKRLDENPELATTLVILPVGLESFFDYLEFLELSHDLLESAEYEGIYQLASFHPDYCFEDVKQDDTSNYTNRSPFPTIHIIREDSLERVLASYPNPEHIPQRNIDLANKQGATVFENILKSSLNNTSVIDHG